MSDLACIAGVIDLAVRHVKYVVRSIGQSGANMPYEITWNKRGACRRFWGVVSQDDVRQSFKELHAHPDYDNLLCVLHDETEVTGHAFGKSDILLLGANHLGASVSNPSLIDLVVTTNAEFVSMLKDSAAVSRMPTPIEFYTSLAEAQGRYKEIIDRHK